MDEDGGLFARASLDGEVWRDALVHGETCPWCRDLGGEGPEVASEGGDMVGSGSAWMVAVCAVTVVAALLTVLS